MVVLSRERNFDLTSYKGCVKMLTSFKRECAAWFGACDPVQFEIKERIGARLPGVTVASRAPLGTLPETVFPSVSQSLVIVHNCSFDEKSAQKP